MKGTLIYTDPEHLQQTEEVFSSPNMPGAEHLQVSETYHSGFMGFGVAITPSSCYELSLMDPTERKKLLTHLYSKEGLGLSVARLCIGSSDYSPEIYSYDDVAGDLLLEHFSVERDRRYVIPIIREILQIKPELFLFASPWSPPFWMKTGGSMCGGYMRTEFLEVYGDYFVKYIRAYEKEGIRISAVTPQNEPNNHQKGKMPACVWHPEAEAAFIQILRRKFSENGLNVQIWMHDHNFQDALSRVKWSLDNCEGLSEACDGIAFHYYLGTIEQTKELMAEFKHLDFHFTEGGPRLSDHYETDWCKWCLMGVKALKAGYRSFTGWNLMLNETGGPNVGPFLGICGGFVTHDHRTHQLRYSGQYRAYSHLVPYITPKSKIRSVSVSEAFQPEMGAFPKYRIPVEGVVIEGGDGKDVAVLVNPNETRLQAQIKLGGSLWYLEMPADSVCTLIVEP